MTAYRRFDESPPANAALPEDLLTCRLLPERPDCGDGDARIGARPPVETPSYLELALASRRAAGLPDEIEDCEAWRAFGRAISYGGLPHPHTSGADTRFEVHDVGRPCEVTAVVAADDEVHRTTAPRSRLPN